jgi:hypothetical protein
LPLVERGREGSVGEWVDLPCVLAGLVAMVAASADTAAVADIGKLSDSSLLSISLYRVSRPFGTFSHRFIDPNVETLGYSQMSLRDTVEDK